MILHRLKRKNDKGGAPAKHTLMMLKIIFYGFSQGIYSMRELAVEYLEKHIDYIYLSENQTVYHSTLSRFINYYIDEIKEILAVILYIANNMGYVSKELVAIDGCKIKANTSKKFTGNYESFLKKRISYEKMIENLLDRTKLVERDEKNKEEELRKIERLSKNYNQSLSKINE